MKLKKLVLSGFKSFADRTELAFDDGVTCIVGPNGCGKSNVVDAFKWVLGSQSAKSLRGSEMADVIFNGSAGRRPGGAAEVALVFDDPGEALSLPGRGKSSQAPAPDGVLSVSRRLFRSGLSEYRINNVPCRLRDIRELFMDTGVGVDAYSLIEQGKVELFLQAGQDERRAIFDEAAGISKYKARKKEALRKLERVEQNLLRLNDIVQEVDKQLRSIKYQAGKARNYQAYSQRLQELRSLHFLAQYHTLTCQRRELQGRLDAAADALSAVATRIDQLEVSQSASEVEAVDLERSARDLQSRTAAIGGQILTCQERCDLLTGRVQELDEQILAALARSEQLEAKIEAVGRERDERHAQLARLDQEGTDLAARSRTAREEHAAGELALAQLRGRLEDEKDGTVDLFRRTAELHNEINGLGLRRESLHGRRQRLRSRAEEIEQLLREMLTDKTKVEARRRDADAVMGESTRRLDEARNASRRLHEDEQKLRAELAEARERRSARAGRIQSLQEMQDRLEGVASGTRRAVEALRAGRLEALRGMLGDFLETDVAHAPPIEAALAGADQQLLADRFDALADEAPALREALGDNAAVAVLCLDRLGPLGQDFDLSACPRPAERVIDFVRFPPPLAPLMWRLLGRTLLVESLDDARAAAAATPAGFRFVTRTGEVLEADGRVRFGAANRAAGVIARRSELAELHAEQADCDEQIEALEGRCQSARNELAHLDEVQQGLRTAIYEARTEQVECNSRLARLGEQVDALRREQPVIADDLDDLAGEIEATVQAEDEARRRAGELEELHQQRQQQIALLRGEIDQAAQRQGQTAERMTETKVALAAVDEKKRAARDALDAARRRGEAMQQDLDSSRRLVELDRKRKADAQAAIQKSRAEIDRLYDQQRQLNQEADDLEESRAGLKEKLEEIRSRLSQKRKAHAEASEQLHGLKVEQGEMEVRVESLIARAADEMSMDVLALYQGYEHDEQRDWDAVDAEIRELRGKIERLGNVNLDAITEQEELEKRRDFLREQLADIESSRRQLHDLIRRINRESRELFVETFDRVREHFQTLFRKLFSGGRADIMLLDPDNVLESGIEIIARPPGKELRSLSLLSGGEKTMTALSLMFSFFKYRPSPFCLLDEVDAALDEENTRRFVRLVQEFVDTSQFVIISHAKRTMSMADVLYGITMQEAGVSNRISVRFEEAVHHAEQHPAEAEALAAP